MKIPEDLSFYHCPSHAYAVARNYINSDSYFTTYQCSSQTFTDLHTLFTVHIMRDIVPHFQHCMTRTDVENAETKVKNVAKFAQIFSFKCDKNIHKILRSGDRYCAPDS